MACLDTTVLVDLARKASAYHAELRQLLGRIRSADESLVTTRFNVAEMYVGIARSKTPDVEEARLDHLLTGLGILEFDDRAARLFGIIRAQRAARGSPIGDMDILIAATAIGSGHSLITRNGRHFRAIPGIELIEYE